VKCNSDAVGGSSCFRIALMYRRGREELQHLAIISYVISVCQKLLSECPDVRTHGYGPFTI